MGGDNGGKGGGVFRNIYKAHMDKTKGGKDQGWIVGMYWNFVTFFSLYSIFSTGCVWLSTSGSPKLSPLFRNRSHIQSPLALDSWDYIFNYLAIQQTQVAVDTFVSLTSLGEPHSRPSHKVSLNMIVAMNRCVFDHFLLE